MIRYKESFTQLKSLKTEIEHLQHLLEKAKVKMQKDFEIWWAEQAAFNQVWIKTTLRSICQSLNNLAIPLSRKVPCKVIQDSLGFWISIVCWIPHSLSQCMQKFSGSLNPDFLTWGDSVNRFIHSLFLSFDMLISRPTKLRFPLSSFLYQLV